LSVLLFLLSLPVIAATSDWVKTPYGQARLLVAGVLDEQKTITAGLELEMEEGWKTYWRTPGSAGIPPKLLWQNSQGIEDIELFYPAPHRLDFQGFQLYGYKDRVIFPLTITRTSDLSLPIKLSLDARLLICRELCIPASFAMDLELNKDNQAPDIEAAFAIDQFKAKIPLPAKLANIPSAYLTLDQQQKRLQVEIELPENLKVQDLFPELKPEPELGKPIIQQQGNRLTAQFPILRKKLPDPEQNAGLVIRTNLGAYKLDTQWQALSSPLIPLEAVASNEASNEALWFMLLMALSGGLILNLMPCVLPVLSIKVLHLIKHQELKPHQIRTSFLATALGIISSFAVLASIMIGLKASGQAIGWGIQFQQPLFISALAIAVILFAANLWGRFEFSLPGFISNVGNLSQTTTQETNKQSSWLSSFAQGALATLLATPCSAPFLGTAIGFAFAQDAPQLLAIFITMGIGLALPYLVLMLQPEWVHKLPKAGPWMHTLKKVLSIGLLITATWLLWVLSDLVVFWGIGLLVLLLLVWWFTTKIKASFWLLPVLAWLSVSQMPMAPPPIPTGGEVTDQIHWQRFKPKDIQGYVSSGKVVFIDITARWCVTCVANKLAVIHTEQVQKQLNAPEVIAMQGDWTRPDPVISRFLNNHQRFGIPFNAVYGPGAPQGILLGEILSQDELLQAIDQAR
jgi:suppressor for copper-sensitivity B